MQSPLDFTGTVERILQASEGRHLTSKELSALSVLCTTQSSSKRGLDDDLGFSDVDPNTTGQLVEALQAHAALASSVDFVGDGLKVVQQVNTCETLDSWLLFEGKALIDRLFMGLEAASIVLFIMNSPGIDRSVISEDAIEACIVLFRHHLSKNVLPALNQVGHIVHSPKTPTTSAKKRRRSADSDEVDASREMKKVYRPIYKTIGFLVQIVERLETLVQKVPLDDQPLLMISSGALLSLELDPVLQADIALAHQLHEASVGVITAIFRKYPRHRHILLEDLFPVMLKLPTYKKSMRTFTVHSSAILFPTSLQRLCQSLVPTIESGSIQTITVLILSLIQSSVVRPLVLDEQQEQQQNSESREQTSGLVQCQAVSDVFVTHLLRRCAKKGEDGGASEFRPILANLIDDLLLILLVPEYPAAEMLLTSIANGISRELLQLSQAKTVETTHVNTILDALSKICAAQARILRFHRERPVRNSPATSCYCQKMDGTMVECEKCHSKYHSICVAMSKGTALENWYCDACQLGRVVAFEQDRNTNQEDLMACSSANVRIDEAYCMRRLMIDYLSILIRNAGIVGLQDAYEFHLARWLLELKDQQILQARVAELWDPRESSVLNNDEENTLNGMLHCLSDEGRSRIMVDVAVAQSNLLLSHRSLIGLFVNQLIGNKNSALIRKLALKAIEKVTDADPQLMIYPFVRNSVTKRFSDEAISVREAAVSLVGLYVVHSPAVANAFHPAFMVGLQDPGVSVRKRTIKILQDVLCSNPAYKGRAEACTTMLSLAADPKEDDSVRDAIHDLFLKIWLENADEKVDQISSHSSPDRDMEFSSPSSKVIDVQFAQVGALGPLTPTRHPIQAFSPSTAVRETRSTERRSRKRRLQARSEIAAEQMVEVAKQANSGEHLKTLFRDLLENESDGDKGTTTSSRKKRRTLAQGHCGMLVDALFEILLRVEENRVKSRVTFCIDVVAVMRTIGVFTNISPNNVHRHLDTLLPYLKADNGMPLEQEAVVVASVCNAVARVAPVLSNDELDDLGKTSLADDLLKITYKFGRDALSSAIQALCTLAHHRLGREHNPFRNKLLSLARTFYGYLLKHRNDDNITAMTNKAKANVQRALSVLGAICRYDESITRGLVLSKPDDVLDDIPSSELDFAILASVFERLFSDYLSKTDAQTKCAALRGLCGIFISHPREMLRMDQSGLISQVMAADAPISLQLEALTCWRDILLTEEARIESGEAKKKMDAKAGITVSKKISGDQDADATIFGGVLTSHSSRLLQMTQDNDKNIRFAALDLVGHLLRQGQLNPNEAVPFLLALQGDVHEDRIRSHALRLLMIEGEKRPDMLRQRVYAGIKQAFAFQKGVYPTTEHISALVSIRKDGTTQTECVFGKVFSECLAGIRKQRRGLFASLLRRFDLQNIRKNVESSGKRNPRGAEEKFTEDLPLLSFTAQVLAYLPYKVASDPLFIIYTINAMLALRGPDLLDRLASFLRPYGLSCSDEMEETNHEEDALEIAAKRQLPHHAKEATPLLGPGFDTKEFRWLCAEAAAQTLLLRLKAFLRSAYDLSESRIFGFNPDTKEEKEKTVFKGSTLTFDSSLSMVAHHAEDGRTEIDSLIIQYADYRRLMRADANLENFPLDDDEDNSVGGVVASTKKRRRSTTDSAENE